MMRETNKTSADNIMKVYVMIALGSTVKVANMMTAINIMVIDI